MKEEVPSILISDGWITDENEALVEVVIPSTVETYQAPTKITFKGDSFTWLPVDTTKLVEFVFEGTTLVFGTENLLANTTALTTFSAPNCTNISKMDAASGNFLSSPFSNSGVSQIYHPNLETYSHPVRRTMNARGLFATCPGITTLNLPKLKAVILSGRNGVSGRSSSNVGLCHNCANLSSISFPFLETIDNQDGGALFYSCSALTTLTLPSLKTLSGGGPLLEYCGGIQSVSLPVIQTLTTVECGAFRNLTSLTSVQLGSEGNPISSIPSSTFSGCTQSGLTITIYTTGGASLSGSPWGATNATIVYESA